MNFHRRYYDIQRIHQFYLLHEEIYWKFVTASQNKIVMGRHTIDNNAVKVEAKRYILLRVDVDLYEIYCFSNEF